MKKSLAQLKISLSQKPTSEALALTAEKKKGQEDKALSLYSEAIALLNQLVQKQHHLGRAEGQTNLTSSQQSNAESVINKWLRDLHRTQENAP